MISSMRSGPNHMSSSLPSPSPEITYDQVPLISEDSSLGEKGERGIAITPISHASFLQSPWLKDVVAHKTLLAITFLASALLFIIVVSSFTVHTPGSYVHLYTVSEQNLLQPDYKDPSGGPVELSGTHRCGSYPGQAKARGCVFDIMNFGWTAPECYYENLSMAGISKGPWKWYLDPNFTVEVPQDYAKLGRAVEVYTTRGYQLEHCRWALNLVARAKANDSVLVPQVLAQINHTARCGILIEGESKDKSLDEITTWMRVVYNSCVKLSEAEVPVV